ncbi:MAG: HTH domain-containing protein [Promethearchaeota archaeon]|nr:MAG: HTH domain-containing protein [Candidatus Lokiarchaeota archaeon]
MKITIPKENVDYEAEILEYIKKKTDGVTITDIAEDTDFSRNTVSKYVSILGLKKKIFSRKVGAYKLYFNAEEISFPKLFTIAYYKGLLSGLKRNFPDSEEIFKEIGRNCYEYIDFSLGPMISKELKGLKVNRLIKIYYEVFGRFYPSYEVAQPLIDISVQNLDENNTRTILKFSNSEFLQTTDDFLLHAYIIAGLIEELWVKEVGRKIKCNVGKVHISEKKEESFYELYLDVDKRKF